jgi:hypothetical protein
VSSGERGFAGIDSDADGTVLALAATPFEGLSIVCGRNGSFEEVRPFEPGRAVVVIDFFVRDSNFWLVTDQKILRARPDEDPQPVYGTGWKIGCRTRFQTQTSPTTAPCGSSSETSSSISIRHGAAGLL